MERALLTDGNGRIAMSSDNTEQPETLNDVAKQAVEEMDYKEAEGNSGQQQSVSIPCQLRFTEDPDQGTERFHLALDIHNFTPLDSQPETDTKSPCYDGEIASRERYSRMRVLVFRDDLVRIYPHNNHVPNAEELALLLHAITVGFKSDLKHDPIEDDYTQKTTANHNE